MKKYYPVDNACCLFASFSMKWKAYTVIIEEDEESQVGKKEKLTEIPINETIPSWSTALLDVPPRVFEYGLHKLVFRFEIETGNEDIPMYKEAFTYINITKSPLMPVLIEGSASKVSRGWKQALTLFPGQLSIDPDYPEEKVYISNTDIYLQPIILKTNVLH